MQNESSVLSFLKENKDIFKKEFHVSKIGLFGSYARGEATEESDIDLLIEFDGEVDICSEKYLKPYVKDEIFGEVIYV